jgi:diaminopimelate decarboxylase
VAAETGTPAFLISAARLRHNYRDLERDLAGSGATPRIRYCAKTNHEAGVLRVLADLGAHCLVSHLAELELALHSGFPPSSIAYQRPILGREEVDEVVRRDVGLLHVHRREELAWIERAVAARGRGEVKLSLRVRTRASAVSPLGRLVARFGFDPAEALAAGDEVRERQGLRLTAVNFYLGTQQSSPRAFDAMVGTALRLAAELRRRCGQPVEEVNLGGGIPSSSLRKISPLHLWRRFRDAGGTGGASAGETFAARLAACVRRRLAASELGETPVLAVEAGRGIVGDAGLLLTRVAALDGSWATLDASSNHLPESTLLFQRRILPLEHRGNRERFYHLSGSSLNTMDVLDWRRRLPRLEVGDVLAFCDAGAYSISRARRYAGLSPPVYLLDADGGVRRIRRAEDFNDLVAPMEPDPAAPMEPDANRLEEDLEDPCS